MSSTYFAEGLPYSVVHQIASQLFTAWNAKLEWIGLVSLYGLAWNLKFLWSPLVDLFGTARKWQVILQLLLGGSVVLLAWPAQAGELSRVAKMLVVVAVLAATNDIAIDGYYVRALPSRQQAAYAGLRIAAYRVALLVGNGVLVLLAGRVSWFACFAAAGAILAVLGVAHQFSLPKLSPGASAESKAPGQPPSRALVEVILSFFRQPGAWLAVAFILLYRLGDAMLFSMSTPLLRDLGLSTAQRGAVSGAVGTAVSIAGSMLTAPLIARFSLRRMLVPITVVQSIALPIYVLLSWFKPSVPWIIAGVLVEQLAAGIGTAGFSVYLMRRCAGQYKTAHFAIATSLMSVAATASGSASGFLAKYTGYPTFFFIACCAALPGLVLSMIVAGRLTDQPAAGSSA